MSFSQVLSDYFRAIGCTGKQLAEASGIAPSTLSRYRSGSRKPSAQAPEIAKLAQGIATLAETLGMDDYTNAEAIETDLRSSLEEGQEKPASSNQFAHRLGTMLTALHITNSEMARLLEVDPSYLSRIRNRQRTPANLRPFAQQCASCVVNRLQDPQLRATMVDLSEGVIPPQSSARDAEILTCWLLDEPVLPDAPSEQVRQWVPGADAQQVAAKEESVAAEGAPWVGAELEEQMAPQAPRVDRDALRASQQDAPQAPLADVPRVEPPAVQTSERVVEATDEPDLPPHQQAFADEAPQSWAAILGGEQVLEHVIEPLPESAPEVVSEAKAETALDDGRDAEPAPAEPAPAEPAPDSSQGRAANRQEPPEESNDLEPDASPEEAALLTSAASSAGQEEPPSSAAPVRRALPKHVKQLSEQEQDRAAVVSFVNAFAEAPTRVRPAGKRRRAGFGMSSTKRYQGLEGIRAAQLDFLSNAASARGVFEVVLFSNVNVDYHQEWLGDKGYAEDEPPDSLPHDTFAGELLQAVTHVAAAGKRVSWIVEVGETAHEVLDTLTRCLPACLLGGVELFWTPVSRSPLQSALFACEALALRGECVDGYVDEGFYTLVRRHEEVDYLRLRAYRLLEQVPRAVKAYGASAQPDFELELLSFEQHAKERRSLLVRPPLGTIPYDVLETMLERSPLGEDERERVRTCVARSYGSLVELCERGEVHDVVCGVSEAGEALLPTRFVLADGEGVLELDYTPDELEAHVRATSYFAETHEGYTCSYQDERPSGEVELTVYPNQCVVLSKLEAEQTHVVVEQPQACEALSALV